MTLYHFCADKHVKQIMRKGLTIGVVTEPTPAGYIMHNGWIWLTTDPNPTRQSWATRHQIKYSRTAWRLTIEIPAEFIERLFDRPMLTAIYPTTYRLFDGWPGSENWRIFHGMIPREWIVKADKMEE